MPNLFSIRPRFTPLEVSQLLSICKVRGLLPLQASEDSLWLLPRDKVIEAMDYYFADYKAPYWAQDMADKVRDGRVRKLGFGTRVLRHLRVYRYYKFVKSR